MSPHEISGLDMTEVEALSQERRLRLQNEDIGMIVGTLIARRSCKVRLPGHEESQSLKADVMAVVSHIDTVAPYYLKAKTNNNPSADEAAVGLLKNFTHTEGANGLIIIDGVDYSGRTGRSRPGVASYLSSILEQPDTPAILVLGTGLPSSNYEEIMPERLPAKEFLAQIVHAYVLTEMGFAVDEVNHESVTPRRQEPDTIADSEWPSCLEMALPGDQRLGFSEVQALAELPIVA